MAFYDILLLAFALAIDAALISFSYGLIIRTHRLRSALALALSTGLAQGLMPVGGYFLAQSLARWVEHCDHWLAFCVFFILGAKVIYDGFSPHKDESHPPLSFKVILLIAFATSIDAFVAGSTLFFTKSPLGVSTLLIGFITFVLAMFGFYFTKTLKRFSPKFLALLSGGLLILLGVKILWEHLGVA